MKNKAMTQIAILLLLLAGAYFVLPPYQQSNMAKIMVLASFAYAYNLAYGFCGLLSLGHALFFAAGMYGFGFAILHGWSIALALFVSLFLGAILGGLVGILALRTSSVAFMIITLMFAQLGYFGLLYFGDITKAEEGFSLLVAYSEHSYFISLCLLFLLLFVSFCLRFSALGRVWVAIRENPETARLCGYEVYHHRLFALVLSASLSSLAGAFYVWLFGYVGASFAEISYSILPLLWVLIGGAGSLLGAFFGTFIMFYVLDIASDWTQAYMGVVGFVLLGLILWGRGGLVGALQKRGLPWLQ